MTPVHIIDDYYFREATPQEFAPFFSKNRAKIFSETTTMVIEDWMNQEEKDKLRELDRLVKDRYQLRIFIMKGDEIIGWHMGRQIEAESYYMTNTALFPQYQGKGIYSALLPKLLEVFRDKGFQKVTSRHIASNNTVLVPKLKAGFAITGFEVDERFGTLVLLTYIFNDKRRKAYEFRVGSAKADDNIRKFL
jgi:GNAT superfamily N-acetyltransferase